MVKYLLLFSVLCSLACSGNAFSTTDGTESVAVEADAGPVDEPMTDSPDAGDVMGGSAGVGVGGPDTDGGAVSSGGTSGGGSASGGSAGEDSGGMGGAGGEAGAGGMAGSNTAGSGGSGGLACAELPSRAEWLANAYAENVETPSSNAIDAFEGTRWATTGETMGGEWIEVDFGEEVVISGVVLKTIFESGEGYLVTLDGEVVALGNGPTSLSGGFELFWPRAIGRKLRIEQTGAASGSFWSVYDLYPVCQ